MFGNEELEQRCENGEITGMEGLRAEMEHKDALSGYVRSSATEMFDATRRK
jgi:hypothetical protein